MSARGWLTAYHVVDDEGEATVPDAVVELHVAHSDLHAAKLHVVGGGARGTDLLDHLERPFGQRRHLWAVELRKRREGFEGAMDGVDGG